MRWRRLSLPVLALFGSAVSGAQPSDAVQIQVDWTANASGGLGSGVLSGSFGVFDVVTGSESFVLPASGLSAAASGFSVGDGVYLQQENFGELGFLFTSFASGMLVDTGSDEGGARLCFDGGFFCSAMFAPVVVSISEAGTATLARSAQFPNPGSSQGSLSLSFTTVPEPSGALLILTGLAWLAAARRRAVG